MCTSSICVSYYKSSNVEYTLLSHRQTFLDLGNMSILNLVDVVTLALQEMWFNHIWFEFVVT